MAAGLGVTRQVLQDLLQPAQEDGKGVLDLVSQVQGDGADGCKLGRGHDAALEILQVLQRGLKPGVGRGQPGEGEVYSRHGDEQRRDSPRALVVGQRPQESKGNLGQLSGPVVPAAGPPDAHGADLDLEAGRDGDHPRVQQVVRCGGGDYRDGENRGPRGELVEQQGSQSHDKGRFGRVEGVLVPGQVQLLAPEADEQCIDGDAGRPHDGGGAGLQQQGGTEEDGRRYVGLDPRRYVQWEAAGDDGQRRHQDGLRQHCGAPPLPKGQEDGQAEAARGHQADVRPQRARKSAVRFRSLHQLLPAEPFPVHEPSYPLPYPKLDAAGAA